MTQQGMATVLYYAGCGVLGISSFYIIEGIFLTRPLSLMLGIICGAVALFCCWINWGIMNKK